MKNNVKYSLVDRIKLFVIAFILSQTSVAVAVSIPPPIIQVGVFIELGFSTFSVNKNRRYSFQGSAVWPSGTNGFKSNSAIGGSDIYFGILSPDRNKIWTWTRNNDEIMINDGFVPFVQASTVGDFIIGNDIPHTFSNNDQEGMYLLFLLLVNPEGDPSDISQWQYIGSKPFFMK